MTAKKKTAAKKPTTDKPKRTAKKSAEGRFIGFQKTPIHRAFFGKSSRSGAVQNEQSMKNSTGPVQKVRRQYYLLDASELPVGRVATVAATILMGKHKTTFTPGADSGDSLVVINADKAFFSSNKADRKIYYRHSGYPGGLKSETARDALQKHPDKVILDAVHGMMPKNRLSRIQLPRLRVFRGADHNMAAQKPQRVELSGSKILKNIKPEAVEAKAS